MAKHAINLNHSFMYVYTVHVRREKKSHELYARWFCIKRMADESQPFLLLVSVDRNRASAIPKSVGQPQTNTKFIRSSKCSVRLLYTMPPQARCVPASLTKKRTATSQQRSSDNNKMQNSNIKPYNDIIHLGCTLLGTSINVTQISIFYFIFTDVIIWVSHARGCVTKSNNNIANTTITLVHSGQTTTSMTVCQRNQ